MSNTGAVSVPAVTIRVRRQRLSQNLHNTEVVFPQKFRQVMAILLAKYDRSADKGDQLPADYSQLQ